MEVAAGCWSPSWASRLVSQILYEYCCAVSHPFLATDLLMPSPIAVFVVI